MAKTIDLRPAANGGEWETPPVRSVALSMGIVSCVAAVDRNTFISGLSCAHLKATITIRPPGGGLLAICTTPLSSKQKMIKKLMRQSPTFPLNYMKQIYLDGAETSPAGHYRHPLLSDRRLQSREILQLKDPTASNKSAAQLACHEYEKYSSRIALIYRTLQMSKRSTNLGTSSPQNESAGT
ncbi:hypothetical protein L596_000680 [Steinernema carpocapsae]|uniref:Uncharacterized protein n=1 Tax=Steinernema carpocapsae TaxID=34508 RepID=A0A4U8UJH8_STECR|nr:hypothetical protein L596_000680 [Steinernema carpocapsae]